MKGKSSIFVIDGVYFGTPYEVAQDRQKRTQSMKRPLMRGREEAVEKPRDSLAGQRAGGCLCRLSLGEGLG